MHLALEGVERDLAHHRVDHVLDLGGQHRLALHRIAGLVEEAAEGEHLAEHAGRLASVSGVGAMRRPLGAASTWCTPWPEFVGERHHVPRLAW
jgi:hypothetical protein